MVLPPAQLVGTWNGRRIDASGRAVRLEGPGFPASYLDATPEADGTDPVVIAEAAALVDVASALKRVQTSVALTPYSGSLHGARGVIYGRSANALDRASLLVALLRAMGTPARYRFGALQR